MTQTTDLFEQYDELPQEVKDVLESFDEESEVDTYEQLKLIIEKLKPLGYTCEYGLSGELYNLRKL